MQQYEPNEPIAIVGMECVLPGAANLKQYWANLATGTDCITDIPPGRMNGSVHFRLPDDHPARVSCTRGGFVPDNLGFDAVGMGVIPKTVSISDPDQFLMLQIADGAMRDAQIQLTEAETERTDVIIGRGGYHNNKMSEIYLRVDLIEHLLDFFRERFPNLSENELREMAEAMRDRLPPPDGDSFTSCMPNIVASRVANRMNLRGAAMVVDAACASGLLAVDMGMQRLRNRQCDVVLTGAVHMIQLPTVWYVFDQLGALSPTGQIRPFDRRANGVVIGEGAGAVVMKRLSDAQRDGNRIYAVIRGIGVASDGRDTAILSPNHHGQMLALRRAYDACGVSPDSIGLLETHGTATAAGDATELKTIREFYSPGHPIRAMGSVKSMIGHTLPMAGMASLIKVALSLHNELLPPTLHCEQPAEGVSELPFYINDQPRAWFQGPNVGPRRAAINAFGFGGINAHAILEQAPRSACIAESPPPDSSAAASGSLSRRTTDRGGPWPTELLVFGAANIEGLRGELGRVLGIIDTIDPTRSVDVAADCWRRFDKQSNVKLCLLISNLQQAKERLTAAEAELAKGESPRGEHCFVSLAKVSQRPQIAGVFPGIGFPGLVGNYPDHLMKLCRHFPEVRAEFDKIELRDNSASDPIPTNLIFSPPGCWEESLRESLKQRLAVVKVASDSADEQEIADDQRNLAASCISVSNWVSWVLLNELNIPVDSMCGQSQGEMAAMAAAGMLDINEVIPKFWDTLAVSARMGGNGRLAFIATSEEGLQPLIEDLTDVAIAIHVAPKMLVLGGPTDQLQRLVDLGRSQGIIVQLMPYPPIHTPQMSHMRDELRRLIDLDLPICPPKIKVYSAITERPFPADEAEVRELAISNLDRPVRFWQTIRNMYEDGARVFIQVGGGSLAANIATILPSDQILLTAVDVDHHDPLTQLQIMYAKLITAGVPVDLDLMFRHREISEIGQSQNGKMLVPYRLDWIPFAPLKPQAESAAVSAASLPVRSESPTEQTRSQTQDADFRREPSQQADAGSAAIEELAATAPTTAESGVSVDSTFTAADSSVSEPLNEPEPGMPEVPDGGRAFMRTVLEYEENAHAVVACRMDLDQDLFLEDHAFLAPSISKSLQDRLPVVPMMFAVEIMSEIAAMIVPAGKVIRVENIQARRWIAAPGERQFDLTIKGDVAGDVEPGVDGIRVLCEIQTDGNVNASATVVVSQEIQETLAFEDGDDGTNAWPFTARTLYDERYMFHGPRLQGIHSFETIGPRGATAVLHVSDDRACFRAETTAPLLVSPIVLDNLTQVFGSWISTAGYFALPSGVNAIEFYDSAPPVGSLIDVRMRVTSFDPEKRRSTSDLEVITEDGFVWMRVVGLQQWLFHYPLTLRDGLRLPYYHTVSIEQPTPSDGANTDCTLMRLERVDLLHANLDWIAYLHLSNEELVQFEALRMPARQRDWLMGRIAAKDAARLWLARNYGTSMPHPADVMIANEESGAPYIQYVHGGDSAGYTQLPQISISHSGSTAIAVASPVRCGIDLETESRAGGVIEQITSEQERSLLASSQLSEWAQRAWCAKESVAKYLTTGLQGRPLDFQVVLAEQCGKMQVCHRPTAQVLPVLTWCDGNNVMGIIDESFMNFESDRETSTS